MSTVLVSTGYFLSGIQHLLGIVLPLLTPNSTYSG